MTPLSDILTLLPQRPPFVMVDTLLSADPAGALSAFLVREDNIFTEKGCFLTGGLLENMAQTCAAHRASLAPQGTAVRQGVIGAVSRMQVFRLPRVGETLHTRIRITAQIGGMSKAEAEIHIAQELIATASLSIVTEA